MTPHPLARRLTTRALLVIAPLALIAQAGALHWAGDALALFSDTFLWLALALLAASAWLRAWRWAAAAAAIALLCALQLTGSPRAEPPAAPSAAASDGRSLRLLMYNIYYQNPDLDAVVAEVERHDPDIVFLMEYSFDIQARLEERFAAYPYRLIEPSRFTMGLALFSRVPIDAAEVYRAADTRIPVYEARMRIDGRPFTFVGGHPWPPQPQWGQLHRDQLIEIVEVAERQDGPLIVAGDFNAAPWSAMMRQLSERAGVRQVRHPLDMTKTFRVLPLVGLPLDHILVSDEWDVLAYQYGDAGGSDHRPLVVDLALPAP